MEHGRGAGAVLIRHVGETGSTNADLAALAREGATEATWLRADRQVAGRGRQGRDWASPVGNLYASTIIRPRASDPPVPTLTLVAAVALHEAVSVFLEQRSPAYPLNVRHSGEGRSLPGERGDLAAGGSGLRRSDERGGRAGVSRLAIKWPNDLLLGGAKMSGILLEGAGEAVIAGFGVNVAHHPDLPDRPTTSLAAHDVAVTPETLLDVLVETFARWLTTWRGQGLAPVRAAWLDRAHPIGTALSVRQPDGSRLEGLFDGLDAGGALLLRLGGGERRVIHAADVFLL